MSLKRKIEQADPEDAPNTRQPRQRACARHGKLQLLLDMPFDIKDAVAYLRCGDWHIADTASP